MVIILYQSMMLKGLHIEGACSPAITSEYGNEMLDAMF